MILYNIEILGETIQKEDNLEDISSSGELLVDKDGTPILNSSGKKQYKTTIRSGNINLLDETTIIQGVYNYGDQNIIPDYRDSNTRGTVSPEFAIPVKANETITCISGKFNFAIAELNNGVSLGDTGWLTGSHTIKIKPETTHIAFNISLDKETIKPSDIKPGDITLYYGNQNIEPTEHTSTSIDLITPHQLQKLGNTQDKIIWNHNKSSFVSEKHIEDLLLNGSENWYMVSDESDKKTLQFGLYDGYSFTTNTHVISNKFKQRPDFSVNVDTETISIRTNNQGIDTLYIRINKDRLDTPDLNGFKKWLKNNNTSVKYILESPEIYTLKPSTKNTLNYYQNETNLFYFTRNKTQPTLNITIDRIGNLAIKATEDVLLNPNTTSISNARELVNIMDESLLKDILQSEINNILDIKDITMEKKHITANTDIYIKSKNTLSISLSTNSITFEDFNGIEDQEMKGAVNLNVTSSLPYSLYASLASDFTNADNSENIKPMILSIKDATQSQYKTFSNEVKRVEILSNPAVVNHNVDMDIKLNGGILSKADIYKATIKFEATQK